MKNTTLWIIIGLIIIGGAILYSYLPSEPASADLTTSARTYCDDQNVATVHISQSKALIRVTSSLLGGGATYYRNGDEPLQCPVVGPDSMSIECKAIMDVLDWEEICAEEQPEQPSHEEAEITAFNFILDFIAIAPPEPDEAAANRIMTTLSVNALTKINRETLSRDLAQFIGVQDVPDQGASVEDLQIVSDAEAYLVVGLNYSGGRIERNVHLVVEDGMWKVDRISTPESSNENMSSPPLLGGDRDEHGCIPSAGYQWCESKQKCLRSWEESCNSNGTDTSSWQLYQNDTLGFALKFPQSWNGFEVHEEKFPTQQYVNFSFSDTNQPFEIFKIVQFSKDEWEKVSMTIPFVIMDATTDPPLICDGCCTVNGDTTGGGQFDAFQRERCAEVPEILGTFVSTRK